jgi:hypothetical protein
MIASAGGKPETNNTCSRMNFDGRGVISPARGGRSGKILRRQQRGGAK